MKPNSSISELQAPFAWCVTLEYDRTLLRHWICQLFK